MPKHTINGHQIHYEAHGKGQPLLLIHSFLCCTEMWQHQIEHLSQEYRVIVMDIRGHGQSSPSSPHSIYDLVDDAVGLLDAEGIESAVWLGLSIGGMISMRAALTHPDRVKGLILLSTDSLSESFLVKVERRVLGKVVKYLGIMPVIIPVLRKMFGKTTHRSNQELIKTWRQKFLKVHPDSMLESLQALLKRDDVSIRLRDVSVPTLIIHGTEDRAIPVALGKNIKTHLPHADLKILDKSGHLLTLESPEDVNTHISNFLTQAKL